MYLVSKLRYDWNKKIFIQFKIEKKIYGFGVKKLVFGQGFGGQNWNLFIFFRKVYFKIRYLVGIVSELLY